MPTDHGAIDDPSGAPHGDRFDLERFGLTEMLRCGPGLRTAARGAPTMERAAQAMVRYLYDAARDPVTGEPACALVRCFATLPFERLDVALQQAATRSLGDVRPAPDMRCLTLLATLGQERAWCSRHGSRGHQTIPLASEAIVRGAPMIARLIQDFGLSIDALVAPRGNRSGLKDASAKSYDVFHVEHALGSPFVPAQQDFVVRYGIRSVVGFGCALSSDEIVAMILFSRAHVPPASASRFRNIALDLKAALYHYSLEKTFESR